MAYIRFFSSRVGRSPIPRRVVALIVWVTLAFSRVAFCGEIHDAVVHHDLEKVKSLLQANPDLVSSKDEKSGDTPLHCAAYLDFDKIGEFLLAHKADVNAKNSDGRTPLILAALNGYKDSVKLFLANKADVDIKDKDGKSALDWAKSFDRKEVVDLLRQHGAHD